MIANKTSQKKPISDSKAEKLEAKNLNKKHLGKFLIETAPRGEELSLPSRVSNQPDPFVE